MAAFAVLVWSRIGWSHSYQSVIVVATVFLSDAGVAWLRFMRGKVSVTSDEVRVQRVVGPPRVLKRELLSEVVFVPSYQLSPRNAKICVPRVYLAGADRRSVLRLQSVLYPLPLMKAFMASMVPLPIDVVHEVMTPRALDRRYPGLLSFTDRHSTAASLIWLITPALVVFVLLRLFA